MPHSSNYENRSVSIGGNVSHSNITTGNISQGDVSDLEKTVEEIQQLVRQLSQKNPSSNTTENMKLATQIIETIENNPSWKQKAISAARSGLLAAIKTNPVGEIVAAVVEGWSKK